MKKVRLESLSPAATRELAARLGSHLAPGDLVTLRGELGAGKTEFVRGLALGLGVGPESVASPSFALAYEYQGRCPLVHLDLYRLSDLTPEFLPDLEDYLFGPQEPRWSGPSAWGTSSPRTTWTWPSPSPASLSGRSA